ncbi:LysR family transcriptional regulator [Ideonella livida]|uniref:LysR family transcriptional regulator n=1 Tax=Ideonella livida TaxID=2707176 RepID=A0A7C9PIV3_9BURK|nr:LysR family transcriptional regulator [Ideonella livida]NDY92130.1 LysR family transcriptional regulator [Ideonella livida]
MRFDLITLNLVLAVAETGAISRAAAREHLALAAASKRIRDLETRLGVELFLRRARGVELTEAGRALVRHIRGLHASLNALEREVVEFSHGIKGHLRVAANAAAIAECLPRDLAEFSREHPHIRISLEDLNSAEVQAAVAEGRADVGVVAPPARDERLRAWPYREGGLAVVLPRHHPLQATSGALSFEVLLDYDIVGLPPGASVHELMLQRAWASGRALPARLQVRGFDAIAQLVEAGLGVALLPQAVAERFARVFAITVRPLAEDWARRTYQLVAPDQPVQPAAVQRFIDALACGPGAAVAAGPAGRSP